jgi:alpha-tubulin suppressor-like RCC1 family protein
MISIMRGTSGSSVLVLWLAACGSVQDTPDGRTADAPGGLDGPMADAGPDRIVSIGAGANNSCAVYESGALKCWGRNISGQLGLSSTETIGDSEFPSSVPPIDVGAPVRQVAVGGDFVCVLLDGGGVKCWGEGGDGALGYGNTNDIGDNERPSSISEVDLGGVATQITAGFQHACAIVGNGALRCWGSSTSGQLGYANTNTIGDNEPASFAGNVNVGVPVVQVTACGDETCIVSDSGGVRCWGQNIVGNLGYPNFMGNIGDNEPPSFLGDIPLGAPAAQVACGVADACALTTAGNVRCWGDNAFGQLGYGNTMTIGDNEAPSAAGDVSLGGTADAVVVGNTNACARLTDGRVRCWGYGQLGALGGGNTNSVGDNELPSVVAPVDVGGTVVQIVARTGVHVCALLDTGSVRCWGHNGDGQLGYGNTVTIGDNETPASAGDVDVD